jgi:chromosome segregation ATPase
MPGIDSAMNAVRLRMENVQREFEHATQSGDEDKQSAAREKYDIAAARMDELQKQKSSNAIGIAEMRYSLFDTQLDNAGRQGGYQSQMNAHKSLMQGIANRAGMAQQKHIESAYETAQKELAKKQREYHSSLVSGDEMRTAALKEEIESAEKRIAGAQSAYSELQANLSDQRKLQEKMDSLIEEQTKRYQEAQSNLWNFKFDNASSSKQQQMARSAFFEAQNRFEGAQTDEERDKALADMQSMYGKMDSGAAEMPTWNGFLQTTSGAVESNSVAAQELQERVLNDINTAMLDESKKHTVIMETLRAALEQVAKHTDPNQQPFTGGVIS